MKKISCDIWDAYAEVKVIPTNGMWSDTGPHGLAKRAHMGAGLAKQAADRWPELPYLLGDRLARTGNRLYIFPVPPALRERLGCLNIVTFPTKYDWQDPARLLLINRAAGELATARLQNGWERVLLPTVGCGLDGLRWEEVEPILDRHLFESHFAVVIKERTPA